MKYQEVVEYLAKEFNVKPSQIKKSLKQTRVLENFRNKLCAEGADLEDCIYKVEKDNPNYNFGRMKGCPEGIYHLTINYNDKEKEVTIYMHPYSINGLEKRKVSTTYRRYPKSEFDKMSDRFDKGSDELKGFREKEEDYRAELIENGEEYGFIRWGLFSYCGWKEPVEEL